LGASNSDGRPTRAFKVVWPILVFAAITLLTYIPLVKTGYPTVEFYSVSATVLPVLLVAAMVERQVIIDLQPAGLRVVLIALLGVAESAAIIGVSGIFVPSGDYKAHPELLLLVGGTRVWTNILAATIGTAFIGSIILVASVAYRSGRSSKSQPGSPVD
jgi:hypothetical protein